MYSVSTSVVIIASDCLSHSDSAQEPPSCSRITCQVKSRLADVTPVLHTIRWATETAQLVRRDAFLPHYREERWQPSQWHKLSARVVPNQSGRRALKRSATTRSRKRHKQGNIRHPGLLPHFRSDVCNYYFTTRTYIFGTLAGTQQNWTNVHTPPFQTCMKSTCQRFRAVNRSSQNFWGEKNNPKTNKYYQY